MGFWTRQQIAFFYVRLTHPMPRLLTITEVNQQLLKNEHEKKRQSCARVNTIDRGVFTTLVFSTHGTVGQEGARVSKALANILVKKHHNLRYSAGIEHLRYKFHFASCDGILRAFADAERLTDTTVALTLLQSVFYPKDLNGLSFLFFLYVSFSSFRLIGVSFPSVFFLSVYLLSQKPFPQLLCCLKL